MYGNYFICYTSNTPTKEVFQFLEMSSNYTVGKHNLAQYSS